MSRYPAQVIEEDDSKSTNLEMRTHRQHIPKIFRGQCAAATERKTKMRNNNEITTRQAGQGMSITKCSLNLWGVGFL